MKRRWYWLTGVGFFLIGLLAQLPASVLVNAQHQLRGTPVQLYGVTGSVWSGHASAAQVQRLQLRQLDWHVSPAWLLLLTLHVDVQANLGSRQQHATLLLRPGNHLSAHDVVIDAPLAEISQQMGVKWLPLQGQLQARFARVKAHGRQLLSASGRVLLHDSQWTLTRPAVTLGDLGASVSTGDDGLITARLDNANAPLDVSGQATLNAAGEYQLDASVRPLASAGEPLRNLLQGLGRKQADGSHRLQLHGKLYSLK